MTAVELPGFLRTGFLHDRRIYDVYRAGSGPAVVVIHEIPGPADQVPNGRRATPP